MKNIYILIAVSFTILIFTINVFAVEPTFTMTVRNIKTTNEAGHETGDTLTFEVWLKWTNYGISDRFEFAGAQYTWFCSSFFLTHEQGLRLDLLPGSAANPLPVAYRPPAFQVDSITSPNGTLYLKGAGNNHNSFLPPYIVSASGTYGAKILTFRLIDISGQDFPLLPLNLRFKLGTAPNTFLAYFAPITEPDTESAPAQTTIPLMDTVNNHYVIEEFISPVEMTSFTSAVSKNYVSLNWTTASEINNQGFDIERTSFGSSDWTKVGYISGNGNSTEIKTYSFSDNANTGHYNYRLKQIDFNGSVNYFMLKGEVVIGLPDAYSISQNYPNPFNPSTKIDLELPSDSKVSIALFDISGRELTNIVNEQMTAGYHTVQFNGANLPSGIYFYRIIAVSVSKNFVSTKRMMLVK